VVEAGHEYRRAPVDQGAVTQLPAVVAAPRPHGAVRPQGRRVTVPSRNRHHVVQAHNRDRRRTSRGASVTNLTTAVLTPGANRAVAKDGQAVLPAGGHLHDVGEAGDRNRGRAQRQRPIAELAIAVASPRANGVVGHQRQAVNVSTSHRHHAREAGHLDGNAAVGQGAVAQLSGAVEPPCPDRAVRPDRQTVVTASAERVDLRQAGDLDRRRMVHRRPVAQLSEHVVAPRPHGAIRLEGEVVRLASHHGNHRREVANVAGPVHLDGRVAIVGALAERVGRRERRDGVVAEHTRTVDAPVPDGAVRLQDDAVACAAPHGDDPGGNPREERPGRQRAVLSIKPVAALPLAVVSPGPHRAVGRDRCRIPVPGAHENDVVDPDGLDGRQASRIHLAVAELPVAIAAPRPHHTVGCRDLRVTVAGRHGSHARQPDDAIRDVAVRGRPVTQLTLGVVPPRPDVAGGIERDHVIPPDRNGSNRRQAGGLAHGRRRPHAEAARVERPVPDGALGVLSPRHERAIRHDGDVHPAAAGDLDHASVAGQPDHLHGSTAVDVRPVANLAGVVEAPSPHRAIPLEGQRVVAAGRDGCDSRQGGNANREGGHAVRRVHVGTSSTGPELPEEVPPPGPDESARVNDGRVALSPRDGGNRRQVAEAARAEHTLRKQPSSRRVVVPHRCGGTNAEHAVIVPPPRPDRTIVLQGDEIRGAAPEVDDDGRAGARNRALSCRRTDGSHGDDGDGGERRPQRAASPARSVREFLDRH
jgi:hypothetical protein